MRPPARHAPHLGAARSPAAAAGRRPRRAAGSVLEPEIPDLPRRGADEGDAMLGAGLGEAGVLAQEAIAGVDGPGPGLDRGGQDLAAVEIGLDRQRLAEADGLVGLPDMERAGIGARIDRNGADTQAFQGADDAAGDRAAIGNQDFSEHAASHTFVAGRPAWSDTSKGRPSEVAGFNPWGRPRSASARALGCRHCRGC